VDVAITIKSEFLIVKSLAIVTSQAFSLTNFRGELIKDLVAQGIKVWALAPDYDAQTSKQVIALGAQPVSFVMQRSGFNPLTDLKSIFQLYFWLRQHKPSVVLSYFIKPVVYATLAAWLAGIKRRICIVEGLGFAFTKSTGTVSLKRKLMQWLAPRLYAVSLAKAQRVVMLNPDDASDFVHMGLVRSNQVYLLGGIGVDLQKWRPSVHKTLPITFVMVARLLRDKGVIEFAEAARRIKRLHPAVRFVLLGDVDTNPESLSASTVQQWVHDGILEWPGHVMVMPWLEQATVFVLPSYREGVPRSTQEAMALGLPIITTDVPGCRETVVEGVNGWMVPARDIDALFNAMQRCVQQPNVLLEMGKNSRHMAEQKFDVKVINKRLIALLEGDAA
jgi:glycosyltransferase involved in cell wall biosynthesis